MFYLLLFFYYMFMSEINKIQFDCWRSAWIYAFPSLELFLVLCLLIGYLQLDFHL